MSITPIARIHPSLVPRRRGKDFHADINTSHNTKYDTEYDTDRAPDSTDTRKTVTDEFESECDDSSIPGTLAEDIRGGDLQ